MNERIRAEGGAARWVESTSAGHRDWMLAAIGVLILLAIYRDTLLSIVAIWVRSDTFAHCFLVFPVSLWLIWRRRWVVARIRPKPDYRALPCLFLTGFGWLLARLAGVLIVEQYALIGMIPILVWMVLGWRVVRELGFPLGFLLLAVPAGEFLVSPMMEFTADFTVGMLQISGIPVYREGTFFSVPSGNWSVVEGCSGLRYLVAAVALGLLYAYLSYRSWRRRLAFVVLAIGVPVLANGLRAYSIVMIAHFSDMQLAHGVDHLVYGWVFFGLVMLFLFWLGSFWAETGVSGPQVQPQPEAGPEESDRRRLTAGLGGALAICAVWPLHAAYVERMAEVRAGPVELRLPEEAGSWRIGERFTDWAPFYAGPDATARQFYTDGTHTVVLYLMVYRSQRQGTELITSTNVLIPQKHPIWSMPEEKPMEIRLHGKPVAVLQGRLRSSRQKLLTWRWNRIGAAYTANDYYGKWLEVKDKLFGTIRDEVGIVVATPDSEVPGAAKAVLQRFVDTLLPFLERSFDLTQQRLDG